MSTQHEEARNAAGGAWLIAVVLTAVGVALSGSPIGSLFVLAVGFAFVALYKSIQGME